MSDVTATTPKPVQVLYAYIDGAHFFTSFQVKGLCAASEDLETAFNEVSVQLGELLSDQLGKPVECVPQVTLEEFEAWLEAQKGITTESLASAALAKWSLSQPA